MVILPLDEYELLIDEAFGPSSFAKASEDRGDQFRKSGTPSFQGGVGGGRKAEADFEEVEAEDFSSGLADPIQLLDDTFEVDVQPELPAEPSVELPVARPVVKEPDEADVDEEALQDLWKPQEPVVEVKMAEKGDETPVKPVRKQLVGEEQFYLEPLD